MPHLTKKFIQEAKYEGDPSKKKRCVIWDDDPRGLGLRITPNGKKTWVLLYRLPDSPRQRLFKLADYPTVSLPQARKMATGTLSKIFEGLDPMEERNALRRDTLTMQELCNAYLEEYSKRRKKSWKEDEYRINRVLIPKWGTRRVSSICRSDVSRLHSDYGAKYAYEANRILNLISTIFRFAIQNGYVHDSFQNPSAGLSKFKEKPRKRWLENEDEILRFLEAVKEEPNLYYRNFFLVLLLAGFRKSELRNLKWEDVNLENGYAKLSTTKNGEEQIRQISPKVCSLLSELPVVEGNPYIFPGRKEGHPLSDLKQPWTDILDRAKLKDFRLHDLRRTFVSMLANSGTDLLVASRLAGHSSTQITEQVYSIVKAENLKNAASLISDKVMEIESNGGKRKAEKKKSEIAA